MVSRSTTGPITLKDAATISQAGALSALRTERATWSFGSVTLLLLFCYFWIGLTPFAHWDGKGNLPSTGNLLNQIVVITLFTVAIASLWRNPGRSVLFSPRSLLGLILLWFCFVSLFSFDPATAFRRIVYALLVCGCANAVLLLPRDSRDFARVFAIGTMAVLLLSYFAVLAVPAVGVHGVNEAEAALAGDWRGIFGHKNAAAAGMVYLVLFGLYLRKASYPRLGSLIVILAAIFLVRAGGKTATAMLPTVLILGWLFEHCRPLRGPLTIGLVIAMNVILIGLSSSPATSSMLASLGIDATFTGRSSIWAFALARISEAPIMGYGFQLLWGSEYLRDLTTESWAYLAAHSHNSFLETLLNGGFPALILMIVWLLILPLRDAGEALSTQNDPALTRLFLRIWIFSILLAGLENLFFVNNGPLWFTMLIAVFGLRLQAGASLQSRQG
ncbi:O-antigen ligase family protein [Aliirhizobium smilacinae]|uniref:O-antigen ligase family protein n=1 Tax=Aliirhizobium smilacinae TaxID=1395944 RepID=A0A5C4XCV3_9HYPH|nr:O-antigen ligase [Rhizobium smilacinae]TNM61267.1 O-antigen ligase family protein [Rhizobium smilacinae]